MYIIVKADLISGKSGDEKKQAGKRLDKNRYDRINNDVSLTAWEIDMTKYSRPEHHRTRADMKELIFLLDFMHEHNFGDLNVVEA